MFKNILFGVSDISTRMPSPPTSQAYNIVWGNYNNNSLEFTWTPGTGASETIIICKPSTTSISDVIEIGAEHSSFQNANSDFTLAPSFKIWNQKVVYRGSGNYINVTGLTPNTRYCFRMFAVNSQNGLIYPLTNLSTYTQRNRYTLL